MAMRCHRPQYPDGDCVLLARISFEVVWVGGSPSGAWQVDGSPASLRIDESARPFLAHLRLLQEWALCGCDCAGTGDDAGAAFGGPMPLEFDAPMAISPMQVPIQFSEQDMTLDDSQYLVIGRTAAKLALTLPASVPMTAGRTYVIKNLDVGALTVFADTLVGDGIDGLPEFSVKKKKAVTLVADGAGQWHSIGTA
jgi:hypothetical protein